MNKAWKDETSYQRNGDRIPQTWTCKLSQLSVSVTRHLHYEPDQWLLSCDDLRFVYHRLRSKDIEEAQSEALELVRTRLMAYLVALNNIEPQS